MNQVAFLVSTSIVFKRQAVWDKPQYPSIVQKMSFVASATPVSWESRHVCVYPAVTFSMPTAFTSFYSTVEAPFESALVTSIALAARLNSNSLPFLPLRRNQKVKTKLLFKFPF